MENPPGESMHLPDSRWVWHWPNFR